MKHQPSADQLHDRFDLVIRGAQIYDGSGAPPVRADIAVLGDRIAAVGDIKPPGGVSLDARGMAIAPGFIDVHSHDDFAVFVSPDMDFKVMQGVTTDVIGNCGLGAAPYETVRQRFAVFFGNADLPPWRGYRGYAEALDFNPPSLNVAFLIGHNTIRAAVMSNAKREPTAKELREMRALIAEGIEAGAVGLSTGLIYEPGRYSKTEEIIALAQAVASAGAIYTTHMRNEAAQLLESVKEAIRIGAEAGLPVEISHHKASGRENWGRVKDSLTIIEEARAQGLDLTADQYPYTSGSTSLFDVLHNNALNHKGLQGGLGRILPENVRIAATARHPEYEGETLAGLAARFGLPAEEAAQRIVTEEAGGAMVIIETMDEDDVRVVMRHPTTMIGSDGLPAGGKPHPRLYGTFPRVLGRYARQEKLFSMSEAIHKMTGLPARKFRLARRGLIREGYCADLVVFDPDSVIDTATYQDPCRFPVGIRDVFVNGIAVVRDGRHTGLRPGRAIRSTRAET